MTLDQLESLTEDELVLALYVVNHINPITPSIDDIKHLTWLKKGALERRLGESFNQLNREAHPIFSSLLHKLGVEHEIKYEQPPIPPVSESVKQPS